MAKDPLDPSRLFEMVGRCLSAWNSIENEILRILEYVHDNDEHSNEEVAIGYWSIISFEARLKSVSAIVQYRTRYPSHEDLASDWNALNNHIMKKAQKRAEVAHGSVILVTSKNETETNQLFVPALERQRLAYRTAIQNGAKDNQFLQHIRHLKESDLQSRAVGFYDTRKRISLFLDALQKRDMLLESH